MSTLATLDFKKRISELSLQSSLLIYELDKKIFETRNDKEEQIKYIVSKNIIVKLQGLSKDLLEANDNIMTVVSSLRYALETLITLKFFIKVPKSLYKAFYIMGYTELEIIEGRIRRLEKECELLDDLEKIESDNSAAYLSELTGKIKLWLEEYKNDKAILGSKIQEASKMTKNKVFFETDKILDENITSIFLVDAKKNGMGFQKHLLKTQILPQYEKARDITKSKIAQMEVELKQSPSMNALFDFTGNPQKTIKKILTESPKMSVKAEEVGLYDEYDFIYKFTSKMLHFSSYSILTSNDLKDEELLLSYNQYYQYSHQIFLNIKELCGTCIN
ncbi:hypothetical protein ACIQXF_19325 [Lysinibacillus sp. NPDC097231]|uniref:hypothetical protein n=1 Tax=Lysinibacillus sp. NPDC097231 TaxID=3364142 RepID=UPI003823A085